MFEPIVVCRREFSPEVLEHLNALTGQEPPPTRNMLAREVCAHLAWYSPDGRPATLGYFSFNSDGSYGHLTTSVPHVAVLRAGSYTHPPLLTPVTQSVYVPLPAQTSKVAMPWNAVTAVF